MKHEWGPWKVHDGRGCPVRRGTIVEVVFEDRFGFQNRMVACADGGDHSSWNWSFFPELKKIIRYREKRPKGLQILQEMVEKIDVPAKPVFVSIS